MELILFVLGVGNLVLLFLLYQQRTADNKQVRDLLEDQEDHLSDQLDYRFERERQAQQITGQQIEMAISDRLMELRTEMHQQTTALRAELAENFTKNRDKTDERMQQIQASNDLRLEQMRQTVEEKLEKTLHSRLQTSFETVSKQLESVNKGLGEMQTVARDVGSLNKVLSNTTGPDYRRYPNSRPIREGVCNSSPFQRTRRVCHQDAWSGQRGIRLSANRL